MGKGEYRLTGQMQVGGEKVPVWEAAEDKLPMDPWKHRAEGMRCGSCMFFVEKVGASVVDERGPLGRCRRHAPTMGGFPATFAKDWCGDHKLDETKL